MDNIWDFPIKTAGAFFSVSLLSELPLNPATGQIAYVGESNKVYRFNGIAWTEISGGASSISVTAPLDYTDTVVSIPKATISADGYLSSTDFLEFDTRKVRISVADTTPGYLFSKVGASDGLSSSISSPGGDEILSLVNTDKGTDAVSTHESTYDHSLISASINADGGFPGDTYLPSQSIDGGEIT